jgi:FkbM family methyltransferase
MFVEIPGRKNPCFRDCAGYFPKLAANIKIRKRVELNGFGLSNFEGTVEINYNPNEDGFSSIIAGEAIHDSTWTKLQVQVIPGDDYCIKNNISSIDLLKVDVEGAEHFVLDGFSKMFKRAGISCIQFEFGMVNIYSKFLLKDFWALLTGYGFILGPVMPKGVIFKDYNPRDEDFQGPPNFFAVHKTKSRLIDAVKCRK